MTENEIYDILCEVFGSDFEFDIEFSDRSVESGCRKPLRSGCEFPDRQKRLISRPQWSE